MAPFFDWFSRRSGAASSDSNSPQLELLEQARALVREGKQQEALAAYRKIKPKHRTVEGLIEHAELLIDVGDYFGAVSHACDVLRLDPDNVKAKAIQRRVTQLEEAERRR